MVNVGPSPNTLLIIKAKYILHYQQKSLDKDTNSCTHTSNVRNYRNIMPWMTLCNTPILVYLITESEKLRLSWVMLKVIGW